MKVRYIVVCIDAQPTTQSPYSLHPAPVYVEVLKVNRIQYLCWKQINVIYIGWDFSVITAQTVQTTHVRARTIGVHSTYYVWADET